MDRDDCINDWVGLRPEWRKGKLITFICQESKGKTNSLQYLGKCLSSLLDPGPLEIKESYKIKVNQVKINNSQVK